MTIAISNQRYYCSSPNPLEGIREFFSSALGTDFVMTKDFLADLSVPSDYPEITEDARVYANSLCQQISLKHSVEPSRVEASVEGGIAIVYTKKNAFLKKNYREVFIEVYNDADIAVSYSENYKVKKVEEVSFDTEKIFNDFVARLL